MAEPAGSFGCGERVLAQEVEVAAAVGLQDFAAVEKGVAALGNRRRGDRAARQLLRGDQEVEAALGDREADPVAVPDLGERAAARRVGGHMQDDRAIGGAAHARVGDAHHVLDSGPRQFARDRQVAGLGHARGAERPGVLQYQEIVRRHIERGIVDARREVLERGEDDGAALLLEEFRVGRRALEDRAFRRQRAEQRDQPALRLQRIIEGFDDGAVDGTVRRGKPFRQVSPATVMQSRCSSGFSSRSTAPMPPAANRSSM